MLPRKSYPIQQSPLYRIGKKRDLSELLQISLSDLNKLRTDANYREWEKRDPRKKNRLIEEPNRALSKVQRQLHKFFSRIETPDWLMSGKRGISSLDNARAHNGSYFVINIDIDSFFQSTKREFVYTSFVKDFQIVEDVASILADITTYKNHIPTGTSTSQDVAFWGYKPTFDRIRSLSNAIGIEMTLWVDDLTFSSVKEFPKNWENDVDKILQRVDLKVKKSKTKKFSKENYKRITGTALSPHNKTYVLNSKREEILGLLKGRSVEDLTLREVRSLLGKLSSQRRNEPVFFDDVYRRCKARLHELANK